MIRKLLEFVPMLIILAILCQQSVASSPTESSVSARGVESSDQGLISGIKVLYKTYQQCERQEDMFACLKLKALKFADRALKVKSIPLLDGMELVEKDDEEDGRQLNEPLVEIDEENLPTDPGKRQETLDDLLIDRLSRFLRSHTLQLSVPKFISALDDNAGDNMLEEGRAKLKRYGGALLLGLLMKGTMMAMAYKGVALLAGKALLVAKVALVLSAIIGLKKLVGSGGE
ncbi:hypothetical protein L798_05231, partial [Zootermopsis nevadensis]